MILIRHDFRLPEVVFPQNTRQLHFITSFGADVPTQKGLPITGSAGRKLSTE